MLLISRGSIPRMAIEPLPWRMLPMRCAASRPRPVHRSGRRRAFRPVERRVPYQPPQRGFHAHLRGVWGCAREAFQSGNDNAGIATRRNSPYERNLRLDIVVPQCTNFAFPRCCTPSDTEVVAWFVTGVCFPRSSRLTWIALYRRRLNSRKVLRRVLRSLSS